MTDPTVTDIGRQIDLAGDQDDVEKLRLLAQQCRDSLEGAKGEDRFLLRYFEANAFGGIHRVNLRDENYAKTWDQPEATSQILALRQAMNEPSFAEIGSVRRCQVRTNLAGSLDNVGRPVEALELFTSALNEIPTFAKALGNRAMTLEYWCGQLYDRSHQAALLVEAHKGYTAALAKGALWDTGLDPSVAELYRRRKSKIEDRADLRKLRAGLRPNGWSLGKTADEQRYRRWAMQNCLFLNPLNDAVQWPAAAQDVFHLPSHSYGLEEVPRFVKFYDLMKSEYVGARTLYCEALVMPEPDPVDRGVLLFDSFDGTIYGLKLEKLKAAFRITGLWRYLLIVTVTILSRVGNGPASKSVLCDSLPKTVVPSRQSAAKRGDMNVHSGAPLTLFGLDGRRKYLTAAERARFIAVASQWPRAEVGTLCLVLAYTGCRISEALALSIFSIEPEEGFIAIQSLKKRGLISYRQVPIPEELVERLHRVHPAMGGCSPCVNGAFFPVKGMDA